MMVHENFRWQSALRRVQAELASGAIGEPFWGRVSFRSAFDVYAAQPYLATDERFIIQDLGIHILDVARWCCQANANRSPIVPERGFLGRQLAPLGRCGGAVVFENDPSVQVTVLVEMIVDRGVCGGELLQGLDVPEPRHRSFPSSKGFDENFRLDC
jgi:predicted dehydrogenase